MKITFCLSLCSEILSLALLSEILYMSMTSGNFGFKVLIYEKQISIILKFGYRDTRW